MKNRIQCDNHKCKEFGNRYRCYSEHFELCELYNCQKQVIGCSNVPRELTDLNSLLTPVSGNLTQIVLEENRFLER